MSRIIDRMLTQPAGQYQFTALFDDDTKRVAPRAGSVGEAELKLLECERGRLPWASDLDRLYQIGSNVTLAQHTLLWVMWGDPAAPVDELLKALLADCPAIVVPASESVADWRAKPATKKARRFGGDAAIRHLAEVRYEALRDAIAVLATAGAQIRKLAQDPHAAAAFNCVLWEKRQEEIARLVGWVHMFSALMSAGICQEVGCAPNTDGTATVTMECADTPATWPADMAADFLPLRSVQYLNRMEAWSKHVGVWDPTAAAA